jgi:hypothetical protein
MLKKLFGGLAALALVTGFFAFNTASAVDPAWDLTGNYTVDFEYLGSNYPHEITLAQDSSGNLTGSGTSGAGTYAYTIDSGTVSGSDFNFSATYTADATAVGTVMTVTGSVAGDGSLNGTWTDNYQGGSRSGSFASTSGTAVEIDTTPLTFTVVPAVYDPDGLGTAVAEWDTIGGSNPDRNPTYPTDKDDCKNGGWMSSAYVPAFKNQGQCVSYAVNNPPNVGGENVLVLQKNDETSANVAATADIVGEEGIVLTSLGFDYKTDEYCGAGAPRFNVYTEDTYYFFGCGYGTHTDLGNGWTHVEFTDADAFAADAAFPWPGFGSTTVTDIEIVMDEEGQTTLDNIMINGVVVGDM